MPPPSAWSRDVIGIPQPDGLELWKTTSGARVMLTVASSSKLPPPDDLSDETIVELRRIGMLADTHVPVESVPMSRSGLLGLRETSLAQALRLSPKPDMVVVGAAVDIGTASNPGACHGPEVLRRFSSPLLAAVDAAGRLKGLVDPVSGPSPLNGRIVVDVGDLFAVPHDPREPRDRVYPGIQTTMRSIVWNDVAPLLIGGDHSITAPAFLAVTERFPDADLVVFDAHLDAEEPKISRFDQLTHVNFISLILSQRPSASVYVLGAREAVGDNLWPLPERVRCFTVAQGIDYLSRLDHKDVYISVDVDVLDPSVFPATGHPVPGGASFGELNDAIATLARRHRVVGADVVEAMHTAEHDYTTGLVGSRLIRGILEAMAIRRPHR